MIGISWRRSVHAPPPDGGASFHQVQPGLPSLPNCAIIIPTSLPFEYRLRHTPPRGCHQLPSVHKRRRDSSGKQAPRRRWGRAGSRTGRTRREAAVCEGEARRFRSGDNDRTSKRGMLRQASPSRITQIPPGEYEQQNCQSPSDNGRCGPIAANCRPRHRGKHATALFPLQPRLSPGNARCPSCPDRQNPVPWTPPA